MCSLSPVPPSPPADQERAELAAGRRHLEARQALYAELQTQLDNCPESVREQLQEQLRRVSSTSPLPRPPWATARKIGERWDRTAWPLQYLPDNSVGAVAWKGTGKVGWGSALQTAMSCEKGSAKIVEGVGRWGRFLSQFPRVQPPHNSGLCGLAFLAQSGFESILHPNPMSLSLKEADALETETKLFEDLEFQQLERESRVEEERELAGQGLLRSKAELLRSVSKRKVRTARSCIAPVQDGG